MKFFSRYNLASYTRALVYMLQAQEYDVSRFLSWYHRTVDFSHVEKRKQLVSTPKAVLLWGFCMWVLFVLYGLGGFLVYKKMFLFGGSVLVLSSFVLPYVLAGITILIKIAEIPLRAFIIFRATQKLRTHKALKIAIAGSFGKTTMREIVQTVLSVGKRVASPGENFNTPLGIAQFVQTLRGTEEVLVFELGEYYPGDIHTLCRMVGPDIGIITGVNEAHLEKFKTLDATARTIFELADYLNDKPLYVNGESVHAKTYAESRMTPYIKLYSSHGVDDMVVRDAHSDLLGTRCAIVHGADTLLLTSHMLGMHQIGPLVTAVAIAKRLGLSSEEITIGVRNTKPFAHRLELKQPHHGTLMLDDSYNGNPDGVAAVITFLASVVGHRRIFVTPGLVEMGSRTAEVHREIGRQLARSGIEIVVLIKNSVTGFIEEGLHEAHFAGELVWFSDGLSAYEALPHMTVATDVVLLQNDWPDQYA